MAEAEKTGKDKTLYRYFRQVTVDVVTEPHEPGIDAPGQETRVLYELVDGAFASFREAHAAGGDGEYVRVPLRSFDPTTVKAEVTTKLVIG